MKSSSIIAFASVSLLALPFVAFAQAGEENILNTVFADNGVLFGRVAYAWTSLVAAIIIFALVFKFMAGGQLARPIIYIGFGALANSLIGFIPILLQVYFERLVTPTVEIELLWFGSLVFHLSVILGVFGIAKVFGLLRAK